MKIIRWLLSHSFLILVIVAVIYGYMFWGNLAGEDTPAGEAITYLSNEFVEVEEFVNAVKAKQHQLSGNQLSENDAPVGSSADVAAPVEDMQIAATEKSGTENADAALAVSVIDKVTDNSTGTNNTKVNNRSIEQLPVSISYSHNQMQVRQNSAGVIESDAGIAQDDKTTVVNNDLKPNNDLSLTNSQGKATVNNAQSAANAAEVSNSQDIFVPQEIEQQLSNVDGNGKVVSESQHSDVIRVAWITARKSFYQRNYELSEKSYQEVIDNTNDNFDAYGELGNVYFNQGKKEQAAAAYYEAAAILVRKGQIKRARSLMGLLRHLDQSKADELQQLIDSMLS